MGADALSFPWLGAVELLHAHVGADVSRGELAAGQPLQWFPHDDVFSETHRVVSRGTCATLNLRYWYSVGRVKLRNNPGVAY